MKKYLSRVLTAVLILTLTVAVYAAYPNITSVTMVPPNPTFGQVVTITVNYCGQLNQAHHIAIAISTSPVFEDARISGAGQVFVVSKLGIDVPSPRPGTNTSPQIGWEANPNPGGGTPTCPTCGQSSNDGMAFTKQYVVHVPDATSYPGCNLNNLYLHVGMQDNQLGASEWHTLSCAGQKKSLTWAIGLRPADFTIHKRAEGVIQDPGDLVLFSIDYEYANGPLTITDAIPNSNLELVSWGPTSIVGGSVFSPGVGATSGTLTWVLPNKTGQTGSANGSVWMLLRVKAGSTLAPGNVINNTATGNMNGNIKNATTSIVVGQAVITLTKSQSDSAVPQGDRITYYLEYQVNGSKLVVYQPFDDISGTYTGGAAPPGWDVTLEGGAAGTWTITDNCGTGDRIITGSGSNDEYPAMVYTNYNFCTGIIVTDVYIDPGGGTTGTGYEGSDALVVIRSNGLDNAAGAAYGFALSIDEFIGTNSDGSIGFQRCDPGGCIWPLSNNSIAITGNKWYRVKIEATSAYSFRAKVWGKGDPEPAGWMITWTDPSPPAGLSCANARYAGFGQQSGANGTTKDSYNNFLIYEPRTSANTYVYDTIPSVITSPGGLGSPTILGVRISWNLGSIFNAGGTLTWWGTVNGCDPITNVGAIDGDDPIVPVLSNQTVLTPICPDPRSSITKTAVPSMGAIGTTVTYTIAYQNVGTRDIIPFTVYDSIPPYITFIAAITPGSTNGAGYVRWDYPSLAVGASGTVSWYGVINSLPYVPFLEREIFAYIIERNIFKTKEGI